MSGTGEGAPVSRDRRANVVILGAGPAGSACAAHLGQLGVEDVVLTDRHDFPRDKTCGSGLSPKGIQTLKDLGVWHEIEPLSYPISGIRIVTPGGLESWQSAGTKAEAVVCERRVLDHKILLRATARGTEFVPNFNANAVLERDGRVEGIRSQEGAEIRARFVVIAGGAHCRVGLPEQRPRQTIQAIMGWWENIDFRPNHVEMIFDRMLAPYYGWLFPEGNGRVNIGITYEESDGAPKRNARELFQTFLDKHYKARLSDAKEVKSWKGHPVVWNYTPEKLTRPGALVVGEAGLMTHPATAEGIYQGMRSGMLAAEAISDVIVRGFDETKAWASYEAACKKTFRASFLAGGAWRRIVKTDALDWVVRAGQTPAVQSITAKLLASI
jgi:geranylgeranyl reductase family protein